MCHADYADEAGEGYLHEPVQQRNCLGCHDAHAASESPILKKAGAPLCYECHKLQQEAFKKQNVHVPVSDGDCLQCHTPHFSQFRSMITQKPSELCAVCHDIEDQQFVGSHKGYSVAQANCVGCHDPHASAQVGLTPAVMHQPYSEMRCELCH
jgi:predicted CXXCH cytochrome family protein